MDVQLIVHFKWVSYMTYELYLNKPVKNLNRGVVLAEIKKEKENNP